MRHNCEEIPKVKKEDIKGGRHLKMYFKSLKFVNRQYLNVMFNVSTAKIDSDRLKMAELYFFESFLILKQENLNID